MPFENQLIVDYFLDTVCRAPLAFSSNLLDGNCLTAINLLLIADSLDNKEVYDFGCELFEMCAFGEKIASNNLNYSPLSFSNGKIGTYLSVIHLMSTGIIDLDFEALNEQVIYEIHHYLDHHDISDNDLMGLGYLIHGYYNYAILNQNLSLGEFTTRAEMILFEKNGMKDMNFFFPFKLYECLNLTEICSDFLKIASHQYKGNLLESDTNQEIVTVFNKIVSGDFFHSTQDLLFNLNQLILAIYCKRSCFDFLYWNNFHDNITGRN